MSGGLTKNWEEIGHAWREKVGIKLGLERGACIAPFGLGIACMLSPSLRYLLGRCKLAILLPLSL